MGIILTLSVSLCACLSGKETSKLRENTASDTLGENCFTFTTHSQNEYADFINSLDKREYEIDEVVIQKTKSYKKEGYFMRDEFFLIVYKKL